MVQGVFTLSQLIHLKTQHVVFTIGYSPKISSFDSTAYLHDTVIGEEAMSKIKENKIEDTIGNWESGALGADVEFAKVSEDVPDLAIDEALDLKAISIRLEKSLIEDFKAFSRIYGVGYQPLIRQVLTRFAEGEKRMLVKQMKAREAEEEKEAEQLDAINEEASDKQNIA